MAELNEQQAQDQSDTEKAHRSRSGFWFGIIILLVVVGLAGIGFYFLQGLRDKQKESDGELKNLTLKTLNDHQTQLTDIQSRLSRLSDKIENNDHLTKNLEMTSQLQKEQLDSTRKELTVSIEKLQLQLGKTRSDWLIADAEYLLNIAGQRLKLVGDVHTAIAALEAAKQRLKDSGETGVFEVRAEITDEIAELNKIAKTVSDIVDINNIIQSQQNRVEELALLQPFAGKPAAKSSKKTDGSEDNGLLDMLGVKHSEQPIESILTTEQAKFIYDQLRLKLEMVRIALIQHNGKLYQSALADTKNWLVKNFADDKARQTFAEELEKLSEEKLDIKYPDITSLTMLKEIRNNLIEADKAAQTKEAEPKSTVEEKIKPNDQTTEKAAVTKPSVEDKKPTQAVPATEAAPAKQ